jgi:hypothetical protein
VKTLVRSPVAAGAFYPSGAEQLEAAVISMLAAVGRTEADRPGTLIVPHAGYRYSGSVAASAYALLRTWRSSIRRVALFAPSHFARLEGAAASGAAAWHTALGDVALDDDLRAIAARAGVRVDEVPHEAEHSLEVQLPWLQVALAPSVRILPVAVGRSSPEATATQIAAVGDAADLTVISTDLSHYLPIEQARSRDRRTADAILEPDPTAIGMGDACGLYALRGAVELARRRGSSARLLDLRTSGDAGGDTTAVVGYGSFAIAGQP